MERLSTDEVAGTPSSTDTAVWLKHLEAELARIDVLLRRQVRRWQLAGQDASDAFRGLYVSDAEADVLLSRPLATHWGYTAPLGGAEERAFAQAERAAAIQAKALAEAAACRGHPAPLAQLAAAFRLDRLDLDILLVAVAPALDLRYERLYGYLQDDVTKKRPTVSLVLDLLCEPGVGRVPALARLSGESALVRYHLVEPVAEPGCVKPPLLAHALVPDPTVIAWLLGRYQPHGELGPHAVLTSPEQAGTLAFPLQPSDRDALGQALAGADDLPALVAFCGPDWLAQEATARWLAAQLSRPLLSVELGAVVEGEVPPQQAVELALRDARLTGALAYLTGWDACLVDGAVPPGVLAALSGYPSPVVVAGRGQWQPQGIPRARRFMALEFPLPAFARRSELWAHFLASQAEVDTAEVAGRFALTAGQIRDAVAAAEDAAAQRGTPLQGSDLLAAARAHSNPHLATLARQIRPRYGWADIVLPADQITLLHEIVAAVRGRPVVLGEWGLGRKLVSSEGVTVLFAGPPGTGKTMAAEIIAGELGLDLYKIDLSTVVSKYIGETEKNLEHIFAEAESSNAILFFDEADALFGKRSEVRDSHDRYANIEISYLLQRMEAYDGVTMLATNLRANLDEAFTRRLQFAVEFPFPDEADRLRIWQTLFPPGAPRDANLDLGSLARRFKLAGGNIRNILVSAAYQAASDGRCVTMEHLLHGTRRELQKMGRVVGAEETAIR